MPMHLTLSEYTRIVQLLQTLLPQGAEAAADVVARTPVATPALDTANIERLMQQQLVQGEQWLVGLDKLLAMMTPFAIIGEQLAKAAQEQTNAPLPVKRMRKAKEGNGAGQPDTATVSPVPPASDGVQPASASAPASDELPDFLKRTGTQQPQTPATTSPVPPVSTSGKELSEADVRQVLTDYMNKFGEEGMEKLSALLGEFGATQISTLKPEHWKACVNKARRELIL